jgi:hypothetical protein
MDMSQFIIAKSDQLNSDDLMSGPITVMIERVTGNDSADQPVSVHYAGDGGKPYKPCKSMRRVMVAVWGIDAKQYAGKSMTLRRDPEVMFGGMKVGGIRITHMSHIDGERSMALNVTRGKKALYKVHPLVPQQTPSQNEDPAAKWASGFIAKLPTLDTAALAAFEAEKAPKLAELQTKKPDLYAKVTAALTARKAQLSPSDDSFDDDLTADTPVAKPASDLSGEQDVNAKIAELEAAADSEAVEAIIKATTPHLPFLEERLQMKLEIAFDQARQRVKVPEAAE